MNTNSGRFVKDDEAQDWMQRLAVGEIVKIKGAEFEVETIVNRRVTLKLLSAQDRTDAALQQLETRDRLRTQQRRGKHDPTR